MKTALLLVASLLISIAAAAAVPSSINNDDSCDIKVGPAATLLLPYFEVDVNGNSGQTTLFTITNVTRYPQIAHVTLWTDWAYPVMTFNLFLTGYDIQAINLADVLIRGTIAPPSGTSPSTPGSLSMSTSPNLRAPLDCAGTPVTVPATIIEAVRMALRTGILFSSFGVTGCTAGEQHANAVGYATIDVVAGCTSRLPSDSLYYASDLLFDNVLIGDYQQIGAVPAGTSVSAFDASGNPMVHIRAVPEGGGVTANETLEETDLPYTFYDRYTPVTNRTIDRRQPLPSTFAARYIQGGSGGLATNYTIWREVIVGSGASCASYANNPTTPIGEFVRFDEHENPFVLNFSFNPCCILPPTLPATSSTNTASGTYPALAGNDVGGWLYLNISNFGALAYSVTNHASGTITKGPSRTPFGTPRASQNWVTISMFGSVAGNRMTAELDAAPLGNGCSPATLLSPAAGGPIPIGPGGGVFVCPPGTTLTDGTTTLCTGTNVNPNR